MAAKRTLINTAKKSRENSSDLRKRAKKKLIKMGEKDLRQWPKDAQKLLQELRVHQIELEMQNEQLREAQIIIEESRSRLSDLYDFAPVAYLTFNGKGMVLEANFKAAELLGVTKSELVRTPFTRFTPERFQNIFRSHRRSALQEPGRQVCELKLIRKDGRALDVLVESQGGKDENGKLTQIRSAIWDITERKRGEAEIRQLNADLERKVAERTTELRAVNGELSFKATQLEEKFSELQQAQKRLDHLASFPEMNPNPVVEVNSDGSIQYLNQAARRSFPNLEEMGGRHEWLFDLKSVATLLNDRMGTPYVREIRINSTWLEQLFFLAPMQDLIRVYSHDITQRKHAEQESERLRMEAEDEKRRLEAVMEALPVGVAITDLQGGNIRANNAFEKVWGSPRPAVASVSDYAAYKAWWADTGNPVVPEEWASVQAVQKGRAVLGQMLEIERFDGSHAFVINSGAPISDATGRIAGAVVAIQDITVHREAEMKYSMILATALSGFWIADLQGRLIEVNDALCRMLGYTREELLTLSIADLEADESPGDVLNHIAVLQQKKSDHFVSRHRRKDGSIIDVEVNSTWLDIGVGQLVCFMRDITERKRAEEALRTSMERYRSYIEVTGELGWTTNADGEVVEDIPFFRKFTGQTYEEVKGWGWSRALHPDDFEHTTRVWRQAVHSKSNYEVEYRLRRHDGIYRDFLARGVPVFRDAGNIQEWVGICIDITERKRMEEELRRSRDELEIRVQERTREVREQSRILDSFFKFSITPFVILDKDFNFIRVNEAYAKACRREVSEFPGHNHFELYPSDAKARFEEVVRTKEPYAAIARPFSFPDHPEWGTSYWDWTLTPILDDAGEVGSLVFSLEDVTKRRQAEEAIKAERQRFYEALEMLPAYLLLLTPDYHVPFANRFFRERFGESHGDRCFGYLFGRSEPCEVCETYSVLKTMEPHHWEWTGPDGRIYDVFDFPFTDTDGSTLILEMGIDITERKRTAEALKAAHLYNRSLIEASLDPLITINPEGKVTDVNCATELATGVSREQLIGSDFSDYFTEPEKAREGYRRAFLKGTVRGYPLAIRHRDGMITDVLYDATIFRNEAGEIQGVFAAARDITERKRAEEALKQSENRLRILSSQLLIAQETERKRIAMELHDSVGQMLTAIKFKVENAFQEKRKGAVRAKEEPFREIIPLVRETIEEVRRMQMDLHPSTLDDLGILATLGWFCREYQKIYSHIVVEKEINLQENEVPAPLKVVIYRLTQEAMNNIAKHSRADAVHLSLRKRGDRIEWSVEDNGTGFDLEKSLSSEGPKRGLGLSSMRERAQLSGGTFEIESTQGKGTTLRASWPL